MIVSSARSEQINLRLDAPKTRFEAEAAAEADSAL